MYRTTSSLCSSRKGLSASLNTLSTDRAYTFVEPQTRSIPHSCYSKKTILVERTQSSASSWEFAEVSIQAVRKYATFRMFYEWSLILLGLPTPALHTHNEQTKAAVHRTCGNPTSDSLPPTNRQDSASRSWTRADNEISRKPPGLSIFSLQSTSTISNLAFSRASVNYTHFLHLVKRFKIRLLGQAYPRLWPTDQY